MTYLRTILPPQGDILHLKLPNDLKDVGLEVIILPTSETVEKERLDSKENLSVRLKKAFAGISEEQKQEMDLQLSNLRNEWDRGI